MNNQYKKKKTFTFIKNRLSFNSFYLKVAFDFFLKKAGVLFQSLSELGNIITDFQQLHWVAIVVPGRSDVLQNKHNVMMDEEPNK